MTFKTFAVGALFFAAAMASSLAGAAEATSTVNVRSGPGTTYAVVDVLRAGQSVEVDRCNSSGWCYINKTGPDGWVSAQYISNDDDSGPSAPSRPSRPDVDVSIGFSVPGFNFQIGNGGFDVRPSRPGRVGQVCFYERSNFRGDSFCARPGENLARLGRWNDTISSIDVKGDAQALVCEDANFRGRCVVISNDVRDLGRRADDRISSIRVR